MKTNEQVVPKEYQIEPIQHTHYLLDGKIEKWFGIRMDSRIYFRCLTTPFFNFTI